MPVRLGRPRAQTPCSAPGRMAAASRQLFFFSKGFFEDHAGPGPFPKLCRRFGPPRPRPPTHGAFHTCGVAAARVDNFNVLHMVQRATGHRGPAAHWVSTACACTLPILSRGAVFSFAHFFLFGSRRVSKVFEFFARVTWLGILLQPNRTCA